METKEISVSSGAAKRGLGLEKRQLIGIFPLPFPALTREAHDVFILLVREGEDVHIATIGKIGLDPLQIGFELLLAVAEASIDRELALFESFVEQIFAKFGTARSARATTRLVVQVVL